MPLIAVLAVALNAGASFTWNSGSLGSMVPDGNTNGWANSTLISGQSGTITPGSLEVTLNLSGGWNGDLYAYLVNSSGGFVVLLDRVGMQDVGGFGYSDAGMNVTFTSGAGTSIHYYGGGFVPTGNYLPDATGTTTGNSGSLSSFVNPNGTWSLFIADLSGGNFTMVENWGLAMNIVAVPEVETWVAAALAGMFGAFWLNRAIWGDTKRKGDQK
jgi:subtilisin-like proprotein convertase family protein